MRQGHVRRARRPRRRQPLSLEEVLRLVAAPDDRTPIGLRDKAALTLLWATGIRARELCRLRVEDLDMKHRILTVHQGKGHKDRLVPFTVKARDLLRRYLRRREEGTVFPLSREGLRKITKRYAPKAGIRRDRVSPHVIRHTFATAMLDAGADLATIQRMLGHELIETTQIYTHLSRKSLRRVWDQFHPRSG